MGENSKKNVLTRRDQAGILHDLISDSGVKCGKVLLEEIYCRYIDALSKQVIKEDAEIVLSGVGKLFKRRVKGRTYVTFLKGVKKVYLKDDEWVIGFKPYAGGRQKNVAELIEVDGKEVANSSISKKAKKKKK